MRLLQDRIAEAMRRHPHLSQAAIARACEVRTPSVTDWLNGKTKTLKTKPARLAAKLFGCDQNWIGLGEGLPHWADGPTSTSRPTAPPPVSEALEVLGMQLAAVPADMREALATNLAGWARAGGQGPWQGLVEQLLQAPPGKRQRAA